MYKFQESLSQTRPWTLLEPSTNSSLTTKQASQKIKVVKLPMNELFFECAKLCDDSSLWKDIFLKAAQTEKFPTDFVYKDGKLIFKHQKNTKPPYIVLSKSPTEVVEQCMDFFKIYAGIPNTNNISTAVIEPTNLEDDIKKRVKLRDELIRNYLHDVVGKSLDLTEKQEYALFDVVFTAFILDDLVNENIKLNTIGTAIAGIDGIDFEYFAETGRWRTNKALQHHKVKRSKK